MIVYIVQDSDTGEIKGVYSSRFLADLSRDGHCYVNSFSVE